jgi:hypothetical protein
MVNWEHEKEAFYYLCLFTISVGIIALFLAAVDISTFLGLFIPASVTVAGSYGLYRKQEREKRRRLEQILWSELDSMTVLETLPGHLESLDSPPTKEKIPPNALPPADAIPTAVYEDSISDLSRLNEETAQKIVSFYTDLLRHKAVIREIHTEYEDGEDPVPMSDHKRLYDEIGELKETRDKLLECLE